MLLKYKSRLCVNGKELLKTRQVVYTLAFPQAALDVPAYMKVPQGWFVNSSGNLEQHTNVKYDDTDHHLLLKKNLVGYKQAARNWFKTLTTGLLKEGFVQPNTDHCLLLRSDCIIVVYVDDCLFFSPDSATIDNVISSLSQTFKLKDEGDISAFLGIQITKNKSEKSISLTQPGLMEQIIHEGGIKPSSNGKDTPVDSILHLDKEGPERNETWNYRSIIGKLNYLANNTRPDISMAVHQCARFCSNP
jgi:hypothetical protein